MMTLVALFDLELHQIDVKTTFLYGELSKIIYIKQLDGLQENIKRHLVFKLKKVHIWLETSI